MLLSDLFGEVIGDLRKRWLRSGLTMMGIVAGTLLITSMVSIGEGLRDFLETQARTLSNPRLLHFFAEKIDVQQAFIDALTQMGSPPREVKEGSDTDAMRRLFLQGPQFLGQEDVEWVKGLPGVVEVWPFVPLNARWIQVEGDERCWTVHATHWGWAHIETFPLESGRLFSSNEAKEVLLSHQYLDSLGLTRSEELIGRKVRIAFDRILLPGVGASLPIPKPDQPGLDWEGEVVGLMKRNLFSTAAILPHGTAIAISREVQGDPTLHTGERYGMAGHVLVDRADRVPEVLRAIKKKGFGARSEAERFETLNAIFFVINLALSLVGGAALGVAALGIVNTLLMSVYERTREIGLYLALGANRRTIRRLFALEAATIGFIGGVVGVAAAVGLGLLANLIFHLALPHIWEGYAIFYFPLWLLGGTVGFAVLMATLAGFYPAHRASRLDPIAALRYD